MDTDGLIPLVASGKDPRKQGHWGLRCWLGLAASQATCGEVGVWR